MRMINEKALSERVTATITSDIQCGKVGGVAAAVMQDGRVLYQNYFGDERIGIQVSENTIFRMASMTKPITTAAVLILVDRGLLDLDRKISDFIPGFAEMYVGELCDNGVKNAFQAKTPITVRHLLCHTSGLGSGPIGDCVDRGLPVEERTSLEKVVKYYTENPLDFEPFTHQAYSGVYAFDVAARIVEIVSEMPFDQFLQKELFDPLGMIDTTFHPTKDQWERVTPIHGYENGAGIVAEPTGDSLFYGYPTTYYCGGAGLASTLNDYLKFADMLLNYGKAGDRQILSEKIIREMATPQLPSTIMGDPEVWGLGVRVITSDSYKDLPTGAFGWSGAYGTHFWIDPANKIVAVYMKNSHYDGGAGAATARRFEQDVTAALNLED